MGSNESDISNLSENGVRDSTDSRAERKPSPSELEDRRTPTKPTTLPPLHFNSISATNPVVSPTHKTLPTLTDMNGTSSTDTTATTTTTTTITAADATMTTTSATAAAESTTDQTPSTSSNPSTTHTPHKQQQQQEPPQASTSSDTGTAAVKLNSHSWKALMSESRDNRLRMSQRYTESTQQMEAASFDGELSIYCLTWNLYGKLPDSVEFTDYVPVGKHDIYVIGTQECERSIGTSLIFSSKEKWEQLLSKGMGADYVLVQSHTLAAIHLIVFIRSELARHVHQIEDAHVTTGFANIVGNKGGVAVCFSLFDQRYLFINSHFAAHQTAIAERNQDFARICKELDLPVGRVSVEQGSRSLFECFDQIIWVGDLNYRINTNRSMFDTLLREGMLEVLHANDQLLIEKRRGNVFAGFEEGELTFPPTYKFDVGTDMYDSSAKARIPSYTDRILWRGLRLQLVKYCSLVEMRVSDHKPVAAVFNVLVADPLHFETPRQNDDAHSKICRLL